MSRLTRRQALGAGAAAGLAVVGAAPPAPAAPATAAAPAAVRRRTVHGTPQPFDEVYLGRRIQGGPSHSGGHHAHHADGWIVRIDGQELHVMRNADGTWISVVNHYEPQATPRALARAAVLELQGASLVPLDLA
ncbi:apotyrosinase chaperone MelC1 [Streptomyces peucetius]|uniref:Tyrosinase cofactor n=1 Tax=Streptomyces peucetius TaxID=1950 RepID=A0ABY6IJH5_STRPE|nr:tyrosinase cofactor [Streptomyces peucetius]UYQ65942.1 tyrosinase cofactor [Streptomyces peucetius]